MKHLFFLSFISIGFSALGQVIEVPTGSHLTIQGDLNLPTGFSVQYNGQNFIKGPVTNSYNTFLGLDAGSTGGGAQNTFLGYNAGVNNTGSVNTFVGYRAGASNTSGQFNSFIGVQAGAANTTGSANYFFGTNSGGANTTGSANYFLGDNAGGGNSSGGFNIYIGPNAGNGTGVNGDNNLAIGFESGRANQSGINNTFLGFRADAGAAGLSNATAIGNGAKVNVSNGLVLGEGVNVGIGTSSPTSKLHISTGVANTSGIRLQNLTSGSPASITNQYKFLTVDGSGNVVLGSLNGSARQGVDETLWERSGPYLQSREEAAVIIGRGITKTPADYNLFVSKGILTERVKVAVKNTNEWSDKVFDSVYRLMPLSEVANYISSNKHLPGIPSAKEMVERGNDLQQTDAHLLEKVEELTLYSIQLEKEARQQRVINQRQGQALEAQQRKVQALEQQYRKLVQQQAQFKQLLQQVSNRR